MTEAPVQISLKGDVMVGLINVDDLDGPAAEQLRRELAEQISRHDCKKLVLDFSQVRYMQSLSLGSLVAILKDLATRGGTLALAGMDENVRGVLALTRLDKVFDIYEQPSQAVAQLQQNP